MSSSRQSSSLFGSAADRNRRLRQLQDKFNAPQQNGSLHQASAQQLRRPTAAAKTASQPGRPVSIVNPLKPALKAQPGVPSLVASLPQAAESPEQQQQSQQPPSHHSVHFLESPSPEKQQPAPPQAQKLEPMFPFATYLGPVSGPPTSSAEAKNSRPRQQVVGRMGVGGVRYPPAAVAAADDRGSPVKTAADVAAGPSEYANSTVVTAASVAEPVRRRSRLRSPPPPEQPQQQQQQLQQQQQKQHQQQQQQ
ncbi:hypothetical protein BOX15_Mlig009490g1, partial [Macrostomum lignano]